MHKEIRETNQTLFKGLVTPQKTQQYGLSQKVQVADVKVNQVSNPTARVYIPAGGNAATVPTRTQAPYMRMTQNLNKTGIPAYNSMMTPAPVAQISRASVPQMSMATYRPNLCSHQTQSLYGAAMTSKEAPAFTVKQIAPKRTSEPKMSAATPNYNIYARWGSIGEGTIGRSSDVQMAAAAEGEFVPDMQRRSIMNLVLLGGAAVPVGWLGGGFIYFFVPPSKGGGGGALAALDANGDQVKLTAWRKARQPGDRNLVQGLKGDAHYLITTEDGVRDYAINAVCTHLGCVVPWNRAANKYMCPCHGSQYDETGKVVRGPAPLSLALAHVEIKDDIVALSPWTEDDFRTGLKPWWK